MRKWSLIALATLAATALVPLYAAGPLKPKSLDNAPFPDYDYSRANRLPLTGYFEKTIDVGGAKRSARVYIAPNAPVRPYFTVIAVPDGVSADDFIQKSGWKELADSNEEGLFILLPDTGGWAGPEAELVYLNAAIGFFKGNPYFSIFGEHYFAGYGAGGTALEAWAAANPLFVTSQAYVDTESLPDAYYAQFGSKLFDGLSSGYKKIEIPASLKIPYNAVPVPTWYVNANLQAVAKGVEYWKAANDCVKVAAARPSYLLGSAVFAQSRDSDAWQTEYCGPISKVATLERKSDI